MDDFFRFSKKLGFGVLLVHPTVVSVLLSASVERCFVFRMRDFFVFLKKKRLTEKERQNGCGMGKMSPTMSKVTAYDHQ